MSSCCFVIAHGVIIEKNPPQIPRASIVWGIFSEYMHSWVSTFLLDVYAPLKISSGIQLNSYWISFTTKNMRLIEMDRRDWFSIENWKYIMFRLPVTPVVHDLHWREIFERLYHRSLQKFHRESTKLKTAIANVILFFVKYFKIINSF